MQSRLRFARQPSIGKTVRQLLKQLSRFGCAQKLQHFHGSPLASRSRRRSLPVFRLFYDWLDAAAQFQRWIASQNLAQGRLGFGSQFGQIMRRFLAHGEVIAIEIGNQTSDPFFIA